MKQTQVQTLLAVITEKTGGRVAELTTNANHGTVMHAIEFKLNPEQPIEFKLYVQTKMISDDEFDVNHVSMGAYYAVGHTQMAPACVIAQITPKEVPWMKKQVLAHMEICVPELLSNRNWELLKYPIYQIKEYLCSTPELEKTKAFYLFNKCLGLINYANFETRPQQE